MNFIKRNLASAVESVNVSTDHAVWTDWTIKKAVDEGFIASGWVYKSVSLISRNASFVPFVVKNEEGEIEWDHPITKLLLKPHPYLNRIQFFELLIQWIQLAGNAYIKKVDDSRGTAELWPVSPDRIAPIESKDNSLFVDGYAVANSMGSMVRNDDYDTDNVIHIALTNPAQPLIGISPLEAASRATDGDVAQQDWNVSAMQNRGVVEGVFTFKKQLDSSQSDSIMKRIMDKFSGSSNARKPLVIGSDASYTRLSLTSAEMDFIESRKFNRDEIFIIFGIPPQLGGSQESSTYNNFSASMRIFWESTIIPLLTLMATQFTQSFGLEDGYYVGFDTSGIAALSENQDEIATTAKLYYDMGIPVEQINDKFELGFEAYEGWDQPQNGQTNTAEPAKDDERKLLLVPNESRNAEDEADRRDVISDGPAKDAYADVLKRQGDAVYASLKKNEDPKDAVISFKDELAQVTTNLYLSVAGEFANTVTIDTRGNKLDFQNRGELEDEMIEEFLKEEQVILSEVSAIQQTTIDAIFEQIRNASEMGYSYEELRRALDDTGIFSPERALRIGRTEVGTAASIGQMAGAHQAGATHKTWHHSGLNARQEHRNRENQRIDIDAAFSKEGFSVAPRWPVDQRADAGDRINCRCNLSFDIED